MAAVSVEPYADGPPLIASIFEVDEAEIEKLHEREEEFEFVQIAMTLSDGTELSSVDLCVISSDEVYRAKLGTQEMWDEKVTKYGLDAIWTDNVRPCRPYLRHCVLAAEKMGEDALANFLDCTFLSDRATSIRQYLEENPTIMTELPPPELSVYYSG